jgi:hypothetical protein
VWIFIVNRCLLHKGLPIRGELAPQRCTSLVVSFPLQGYL